MTHKKTEVAKKLKSLPDLLGAINAYYDCSTGLDIKQTCGWVLSVVKRQEDQKGFEVLPRRWVVERTFAWFGRYRL